MIRKSLKRRRSGKSDEPAVYLGLNLLVGGRRLVSDGRRMLSRISSVGTAVLLAARVQHPQAGTRGCLPVGAPITCGKSTRTVEYQIASFSVKRSRPSSGSKI